MSDLHLIHGFHAVTSRLRQREDVVKEIYFDSARHDKRGKDLLALAETRGVRVIMVDGKRLDGMTGNQRHQGVAARVEAVKMPTHIDDVLDERIDLLGSAAHEAAGIECPGQIDRREGRVGLQATE